MKIIVTFALFISSLSTFANSIEDYVLNVDTMRPLGITCGDYGDILVQQGDKKVVAFEKYETSCVYQLILNDLENVSEVYMHASSPVSCYYKNALKVENYSQSDIELEYTSWNFSAIGGAICYFKVKK